MNKYILASVAIFIIACAQVELSKEKPDSRLDSFLEEVDRSALPIPLTCEINANKVLVPVVSKIDVSLLKLIGDNVAQGYFLFRLEADSKQKCSIVTTSKVLPPKLSTGLGKEVLIRMQAVMNGVLCRAVLPILNFRFSQFKEERWSKSKEEYTLEKDRNIVKIDFEKKQIHLFQMAPDKSSSKRTTIEYTKGDFLTRPKTFVSEISKHGERIDGQLEFNSIGNLSRVKTEFTKNGEKVFNEWKLENCKPAL